ncbi:BglG family transcription antiterminator [Streptococcus sp. DD12]|uniref:BglG family transcription antiterminator n=1 Tax=Streptococcus sp. DD12 TaxID=1777880 RepID=UPI000796117D|nr:PRD domain-containing protein [Streptococcus sp. DD12]KXT75600.1 hypothetical protein STRDD12_01411 [Streptococcus sp. DD12]
MDKADITLLTHLINLKKPETVSWISSQLQMSRSKVYYHLAKINAELQPEMEIVSQPRLGIALTTPQLEACQQLLEQEGQADYIMQSQERWQLTAIYIAVAKERVTIEKLMHLNQVSRNTILSDLGQIREQLSREPYAIRLVATKTQGYYLQCHPVVKMQYVYAHLVTLYRSASQPFLDLMEEALRQRLDPDKENPLFSPEVSQELSSYVQDLQAARGKKVNPKDLETLFQFLPYLFYSFRNMALDFVEDVTALTDVSALENRLEYQVAQALQEHLHQRYAFSMQEGEVLLVTILLLAYRKDTDYHSRSQDYEDIRESVRLFLQQFENLSKQKLQDWQALEDNLIIHCKALVFRKKFGIISPNPLTQDIKDRYGDIFRLTHDSAEALEVGLGIACNDDDIANLAVHMGGALRREKISQVKIPHAIVVSDDSRAVREFLYQQCQHHLVRTQIDALFTTEQLNSVRDLLHCDFIISSQPLDLETIPVVLVHPVLSEKDIMAILHQSQQSQVHQNLSASSLDQQLEHILSQYLHLPSQTEALKQDLLAFLQTEFFSQQ